MILVAMREFITNKYLNFLNYNITNKYYNLKNLKLKRIDEH